MTKTLALLVLVGAVLGCGGEAATPSTDPGMVKDIGPIAVPLCVPEIPVVVKGSRALFGDGSVLLELSTYEKVEWMIGSGEQESTRIGALKDGARLRLHWTRAPEFLSIFSESTTGATCTPALTRIPL